MKIIQILLPVYDENGKLFPVKYFTNLEKELTEKYGGVTAYTRSPADGLWKENENKTVRDEIVIYEVMTEDFNSNWWTDLKKKQEEILKQDKIIIRSWDIDVL